MIMIPVLLICCSLPLFISLTPLMCGENMTRPEPDGKSKFGGSRAVRENRLPYYTAGFE